MSKDDRHKRIFVPKKKEKSAPKRERFMPSRPAEGRAVGTRQAQTRTTSQKNKARSQPQSGRHRHQQKKIQRQRARPKPLENETWAYVIEHDLEENVITAISERLLIPCRLRSKSNIPQCMPNQRINIGKQDEKRAEVVHIMGLAKIDLMSNFAIQELTSVVQFVIEQNAQYYLESYFNVASSMSLKKHAFELLPSIGNKKAMQMVDARGRGFATIEDMNEQCKIDGLNLLALRFVEEISDQQLTPRLMAALLPVSA